MDKMNRETTIQKLISTLPSYDENVLLNSIYIYDMLKHQSEEQYDDYESILTCYYMSDLVYNISNLKQSYYLSKFKRHLNFDRIQKKIVSVTQGSILKMNYSRAYSMLYGTKSSSSLLHLAIKYDSVLYWPPDVLTTLKSIDNGNGYVEKSIAKQLKLDTIRYTIYKREKEPKRIIYNINGKHAITDKIGKGEFSTVYSLTIDNKQYACKNLTCVKSAVKELSLLSIISIKEQLEPSYRRYIPYNSRVIPKLSFLDIDNKSIMSDIKNSISIGMDLAETNLENWLIYKREDIDNTITNEEIIKITSSILAGIALIHSYDYIHSDIKPDNILIYKNGDVKIADFGLCIYGNRNKTKIVQPPVYRAPEIFIGGSITGKIDCWSVGIVICEIILGFHPLLPASNQEDVFRNIFRFFGNNDYEIDDNRVKMSPLYQKYMTGNTTTEPSILKYSGCFGDLLPVVLKLCDISPNRRISCETALGMVKIIR